MKSNKLSIAIVTGLLFAAVGTSAFADDKTTGEGGTNWQDHITSSKTRSQVVAELKEARAQGQLLQDHPSFEYAYPRVSGMENGRDRAEVRAEAAAANMLDRSSQDDIYFGG